MKKLSIFLASMVALLSFSSCNDDTTPRLEKDPSTLSFKVNTPPMANQYFDLTSDGTFDLSCSQPDYGFSAVCNYVVMVSLSDQFTHNAKYAHEGEAEYFPQPGDFVELRNPGTSAYIQASTLDLTRAICKLLTYKDAEGNVCQIEGEEDLPLALAQHPGNQDGFIPVYLKVRCYIPQDVAMSSVVSSNYAVLNKVRPFFSLAAPSSIYMTGNYCTGGDDFPAPGPGKIPDSKEAGYPQVLNMLWPLTEAADEIDSKVFRASFYLEPAGACEFRFYLIPPANGWGKAGSYGSGEADFSHLDFPLSGGTVTCTLVPEGLGNFHITEADGSELEVGWYDFVIDLPNLTLTVSKVSTPTYPTTYVP